MFHHFSMVSGYPRLIYCGARYFSAAVIITVIMLLGSGSLSAATGLSWDGDGAAPLGGSGVWDLTALNWLNGANAYQAWDNSGSGDALFDTIGGDVALPSAAINVHSITLNVSGYSLSGSCALNLSGSAPTISTAADVLATISTSITGSSGLQKTGSGVLDFWGTNTYTGTTTVSEGILRLSNANALPGGIKATGGLGNLNIAGGIVELTDTALGMSRNLGTGAGQLQFTGSGGFSAYNNNPKIGMTAGVWLNNGATLTWGSGGFVPNGAELWLSSADSNSCVDFQNPINLGSTSRTIRVADGSASTDAELHYAISGSGGLIKAGGGTLFLYSSSNSYTGPTIVTGGVLRLASANSLPGGIGTTGGTNNLNLAGGVLQLGGSQTFSRSLGTGASQVQFTDSGGFAASGNSESSVNLGGASATLVWGTTSFIPTNCRLIFGSDSSNATLNFQNPIDFGSLRRTIEVRKGTATAEAKLSGTLTGTDGFEKTGAGTLELAASNSYSGPTVVSGGVLGLSNANAIPGGIGLIGGQSNIVLAGGVIELHDANFFRALGTGPDQVQFTGSGGFTGAISSSIASGFPWFNTSNQSRIVNLGGQSAPVAWGVGGFVPDGSTFILGATGASGILDFQNPIDLGNATRTIQVDGVSSYNSYPPLGYVSLSGGITGNDDFIKSGNGILKLTTVSSYSGDTQVISGTLLLAHPQAIPGGIGATGGTSHLSISGGGKIGLDCGNFQRNLGAGPGDVQFSGSGGFMGGVYHIVNFGGASAPIVWDSNPYLPDNCALILENFGSNGPMDLQNPLVLGSGKREVSTSAGYGSAQGRLSGCLSGVGGLKKTGTLVLELTAANTYTGQTEVNNGVLRLSNTQALPGGIGSSGGKSNLNFTGSSGGAGTTSSGDYFGAYGSYGPVVELAAGDFTRSLGTGASQVQFTSEGGFSAFGANRAVNLGGSSAQVVWGQNYFVPSGAALHLSSNLSNATIDFQNPIDFGTSARYVDVMDGKAGVDAKLSGVLSGNGGLYQTNTGTLELTAANTYSGQTTVYRGVLRLSNSKALPGGCSVTGGTSNLYLFSGVIELASGDFFRGLGTGADQVQMFGSAGFAAIGANRVVNLGGNSASLANPNQLPMTFLLGTKNSDATLDFQNPLSLSFSSETIQVDDGPAAVEAKLSGVLSGTGGLIKDNKGTLQLTAANIYTGETQIRNGVLRLSNPLALPGGCGVTGGTSHLNFYGGVLELAAGDFFRGPGSGPNQVNFTALDGGFAAVGANRVVNLGGNSTPLIWGNNFSPWTFVLGSPNADATLDFQNPLEVGPYAAIPIIRVDNGSAAIDGKLSGVLSGTRPLTKTGDGTLQLTSVNTFSGTISVNAGKLLVDGSLTNAPITVESGAILGGAGTVGQVIVNSGGHLAPGDSVGVLSLTGDLSLASGAALQFDLATPGASDLISMPSSILALNGQQFSDFAFTPKTGYGPGVYTLIDAGIILGSLGGNLSGAIGGLNGWISTSGNDLILTVVPEPSTLALFSIGAVGLLVRFWWRKRH